MVVLSAIFDVLSSIVGAFFQVLGALGRGLWDILGAVARQSCGRCGPWGHPVWRLGCVLPVDAPVLCGLRRFAGGLVFLLACALWVNHRRKKGK